jgi:type I restriction enzyme, S subunit
MAGNPRTTEGGIYPRGFPLNTEWPWPLVKSKDLVLLNYGKALRDGDRRLGIIPVYGTNGPCGWHDEPLVDGPGVILGRKGQGHLGVEWCDSGFWVIDTAYYVTRRTDQIDLRYFYYLVKYIGLNHLKDGTSNPSLSRDTFADLLLPQPPLAIQRAIATVLSTMDDKIELNRRMNETLEAMARAIFQSWFVDFDPVRAKAEGRDPDLAKDIADLFPDRFEDSELDQIPAGWWVRPFSTMVEIIGGGTPKTSVSEYWDGNIPWFSVVDAPSESDVFVISTEKCITRKGLENSSARLLPEGTTIISARGTVGKLALVGAPMTMNQSCYGLRGIEAGSHFTYYATRNLVSILKQRSHGSVFDTITRDTLAGVNFIAPPKAVLEAFERVADPFMQRIKSNLSESRTLATIRDTLLPKLTSGELRVKDAEQFLKARGL